MAVVSLVLTLVRAFSVSILVFPGLVSGVLLGVILYCLLVVIACPSLCVTVVAAMLRYTEHSLYWSLHSSSFSLCLFLCIPSPLLFLPFHLLMYFFHSTSRSQFSSVVNFLKGDTFSQSRLLPFYRPLYQPYILPLPQMQRER